MKQIATLLAMTAALAFSGAAFAQPAHRPQVRAPVVPHAPGVHPRDHHHGGPANYSAGWPVFMPPPGEPSGDIVTHEFVDPRAFRPRVRTVDILSDWPVVFREPPHIIQVRRFKPRRPITVVRRGVISWE